MPADNRLYTVSLDGKIEAHDVPPDLDTEDKELTHHYMGKSAAIIAALGNATNAANTSGSEFKLKRCQELRQYARRLKEEPCVVIAEAEAALEAK